MQSRVYTSHVDVVVLGEVTHCEVGVVMVFVNCFFGGQNCEGMVVLLRLDRVAAQVALQKEEQE